MLTWDESDLSPEDFESIRGLVQLDGGRHLVRWLKMNRERWIRAMFSGDPDEDSVLVCSGAINALMETWNILVLDDPKEDEDG